MREKQGHLIFLVTFFFFFLTIELILNQVSMNGRLFGRCSGVSATIRRPRLPGRGSTSLSAERQPLYLFSRVTETQEQD